MGGEPIAGQVVDTPSAQEFMREVLEKVSVAELDAIAEGCERKAALFHRLLHEGGSRVSPEDLRTILRSTFGSRRKADQMLGSIGPEALADRIRALVDAPEPLAARFDAFTGGLEGFADIASDVAAELLHFTDPERFWLWTRWMWDPATETGSLRLVTMDEVDLVGDTPGETYLRVGRAVDFVRATGDAAGFTRIGDGRFGIDVFLACVYGIYMYTVLRMRMTQEFNKVVPDLPELARRLLGVWRLEG